MTDFMYENEKKLKELSYEYFEKEEMKRIDSGEQLLVCKYMLAYRFLADQQVETRMLQSFRLVSINFDNSKENLIFFEKLQSTDMLYLQNYMQAVEHEPAFLSTWTGSFLKTTKKYKVA